MLLLKLGGQLPVDAINELHKAESTYREAKSDILDIVNEFKINGIQNGYSLNQEGLMT